MKLYRFQTFRTSYFFPRMTKELKYMYGLYAAYGGKLSKIYWWLFRNCSVVRTLNGVDTNKVTFPYRRIVDLNGKESLMAFNMGTPGVEQKISILGYEDGVPFFAKYSEKPAARQLTKNEVMVYRMLDKTGLTPGLLGSHEGDDCCWLKAEYVKGKHPDAQTITDNIVDLAISLASYHLGENTEGELKTCLSHGDFCPWNMLVSDGKIRLIDWEVAKERPLGFDLFTFICQVSALFEPERLLMDVIKEKESSVKRYFSSLGVYDYKPYLLAFAKEKTEYEGGKGNEPLYKKYKELLYCLED